MPKVNVYLPDDLAEDVTTTGIALSRVCQRALREEVRMAHLREGLREDLQAVARRLRRLERGDQRRQRSEGYADGLRWAREEATLKELKAIDRTAAHDGSLAADRLPTLTRYFMAHYDADPPDPGDEHDPEVSAYIAGLFAAAADIYRAVLPLLDHEPDQPRKKR